MAGLLIFALAGFSIARQPSTVSFTCRAEPMSRIVKELGVAVGAHLAVAPVCANDVLVISAHDVPVQELMNEIAKVDSGVWKASGDATFFGPDVIARRNEEQHEKAHQGNLIHAAILKKLAEAQKAPVKEGEGQNFTMAVPFGMGGTGPAQVSVLSLLKSIDPPSLVVDESHRVVFSTMPNGMQLPLAGGAEEIIQGLIEQHNKSVPKDATPTPTPPGLDDKSLGFMKGMIDQAMKRIDGYYKADLVVGPMPFLGGTTATLILYDNKGKVLLNASAALDTSFIDALLSQDTHKTASASSTPIDLSPETQAYQEYLGAAGGAMRGGAASGSRPIPEPLKPFVTDPAAHDPLALLPTDQLLALAKSARKPLVAVVPDRAMSLVSSLMPGKPTVEQFVQELTEGKSMVMVEQGGWIEVKPVAPESARRDRTDRVALTKLLRVTREKHVPSLDDVAEFAQDSPSPMSGGVCQTYLSMFVPGAMGAGMDGITNWDMVRIYGQITPDRRAALVSGGRVSLDSLSPTQQGYLNEMVFGPLARLEVGEPGQGQKDMITQMMSMFGGGQDYRDEATELLPSGIPGGGVFEMTAEQQPFLVPVSNGGASSGVTQMVGIDELAMMKFFSEQPGFAQVANAMPKFDQMKVGHRVVYHLTFHLTSGIRLSGTLTDNELPDNAETVSANDLPQDMQTMIAKKMEDLKKSPLGGLAGLAALGGAGAGTPPP